MAVAGSMQIGPGTELGLQAALQGCATRAALHGGTTSTRLTLRPADRTRLNASGAIPVRRSAAMTSRPLCSPATAGNHAGPRPVGRRVSLVDTINPGAVGGGREGA